jgi:hypothetical protein
MSHYALNLDVVEYEIEPDEPATAIVSISGVIVTKLLSIAIN